MVFVSNKMGKKSVLFQIHHLYYLPQFMPVAQALEADGNFEVWFSPVILSDRRDYELTCRILKQQNLRLLTAEREKDRIAQILARNFDVTVFGKSNHAERYCSSQTLAVLLYHGIGFKSCYYTDYNLRLNVRYVEGPYRLGELQKYNYQTELVETGFPKLDILKQIDADALRQKLDLSSGLPTILYAPTFYPSSIEVIAEQLAQISVNFNLIVKLHHFSWLLPKYRHQVNLWQQLSARYAHIRLLPVEEYNIVPYFLVSDLLLTDGSSTAFEFLTVEKPVVLAQCYHLRWKHRLFRNRFYQSRMDSAIESQLDFAYRLTATDQLAMTLEEALRDREGRLPLIREKKALHLGQVDGESSQRVVADLKRRLGL